ncbi:hypothetical protein VPH35_082075 [Triticum aestivum]
MFPNYRIKIRRKKDPHSRTTHLPDPIATLAPAAIPRPPRPRPTPPPLPHPWPAPPQPPHPRPAPPSPPAPVRHRRGRPAPGRTPAPSGSGGDGATPPPGAPRGSPDPAPAAICPHCSRRGPGHQPRRHRVLPPASTATVASLSSASTTAAALCPRPTRRLPPSNQPGKIRSRCPHQPRRICCRRSHVRPPPCHKLEPPLRRVAACNNSGNEKNRHVTDLRMGTYADGYMGCCSSMQHLHTVQLL